MSACSRCGHDAEQVVTARWEMRIPIEPPSQNQVHNKTRFSAEARRYRVVRDEFGLLIRSEMISQRIPVAKVKRTITITRLIGKGNRAYDHANLVGGCKPAIDGAVRVGLLVNDTAGWFEGWYRQEKAPDGKGATLIVVEEVAT